MTTVTTTTEETTTTRGRRHSASSGDSVSTEQLRDSGISFDHSRRTILESPEPEKRPTKRSVGTIVTT